MQGIDEGTKVDPSHYGPRQTKGPPLSFPSFSSRTIGLIYSFSVYLPASLLPSLFFHVLDLGFIICEGDFIKETTTILQLGLYKGYVQC